MPLVISILPKGLLGMPLVISTYPIRSAWHTPPHVAAFPGAAMITLQGGGAWLEGDCHTYNHSQALLWGCALPTGAVAGLLLCACCSGSATRPP